MGKCHYPTIDVNDIESIQKAVSDGWFTHSKRCNQFERTVREWNKTKHALFTTSGSSASLLAIASLTSWKLGTKRLVKDDKVLTSALAFPTTVAPIVQLGLHPVFVDVSLPTCNVSLDTIKRNFTSDIKALVIANTLGNPMDPKIRDFCDEKGIWLIEDNCDGLGGTIGDRKTGTIGHLSTLSFYPAHHITTGEGGMVLTNDDRLYGIARSLRDWGRDCKCEGGQDGVCGGRFTGKHGSLPFGYDHKYVFSHLGYNLKNTELAAALGLSQWEKIDSFIDARKKNWRLYAEKLFPFRDWVGCMAPTFDSSPSWFGYLAICNSMVDRSKLVRYLEENGIQTRMPFAGNILRQPCFHSDDTIEYSTSGSLVATEMLTDKSFWVGVAPTVTEEQIDKTCHLIIDYISQ